MTDKILEKQKAYLLSVLAKTGLDSTALARKAGVAPSTLNRPINNPGWKTCLSFRTLSKVASSTNVPIPPELLSSAFASPVNTSASDRAQPQLAKVEWPSEATREGAPEIPPITSMQLDLDVIGTGECGDESADFELNGQVVDRVRRPPALTGARDAFAVYVRGESMAPRFHNGDLVVVHPGRPVTQNCDVLVELWNADGGEHAGPALIKIFISRSRNGLVLEQLNPRKRLTIPGKRVKNVFRILTQRELFGV